MCIDDGEDESNNNPHPVDNHHTSAPTSRSAESFPSQTDTPLHFPLFLTSSSVPDNRQESEEDDVLIVSEDEDFIDADDDVLIVSEDEDFIDADDDVLIVSEEEDFIDADTASEDAGLTHDEIPSWSLERQQEELGQGLTPNDSAMRMLTQNSFLSRVSSLCGDLKFRLRLLPDF
ncbi:hypothetical protein ACOMHN_018344 [Nucella lapillus]